MTTKIVRCPKCNSKDVSKWTGAGESGIIYTCKYCGHRGQGFIEEFSR